MTAPLTRADLERFDALAREATPGPFRQHAERTVVNAEGDYVVPFVERAADAAFIAAARDGWPATIAALREARARLADAERALADAVDQSEHDAAVFSANADRAALAAMRERAEADAAAMREALGLALAWWEKVYPVSTFPDDWESDDDRDPGPAQVVEIRKRLAAVATDAGRALLDEVRALREVSAERDHLRAETGAMRDALATILKECIKEIDDEEYAATCPYWNAAVYAAKAALSGTATTAYAARVTALEAARDALAELVEVASLRGDNDLPHPANDEKLWTARMQTAWDDAQAALDADPAYIRGLTTAVRSVKARVEAMNPKRRLT